MKDELNMMRQSLDAKTQELEEKTNSVQALGAKVQALEGVREEKKAEINILIDQVSALKGW